MRYPRQISHQIISNDISLIIGGEKPGKKYLMIIKFLHKLGNFNFPALHCTASKKGTTAVCFLPSSLKQTHLWEDFFRNLCFNQKICVAPGDNPGWQDDHDLEPKTGAG